MQQLKRQYNRLHVIESSQQVHNSISCTSKMVSSSGLLHAWSNESVRYMCSVAKMNS